jgi:branched-chain amino acid transport system permease protein
MFEALLTGIALGCIYGLVAMGFAIAFLVTRVINFAQGQLLMISVMVAAAASAAGWPSVVAMLAGVACAAGGGVVTYLLAVRPVLAFDRFSFAWLVSTLGVALVLENGAALIWGPTSRPFPILLNGSSAHIGSATLSWQQVLAMGVAVFLVAAYEFFRRHTLYGKVGMAVAHDPEMASAIGANTTLIAVAAFALAGLLAGVAGVLIGPITYANPYLGDTYGINGFVALMIGGADYPVGAMVGGVLLGVLNNEADVLINTQASDWFPFLVVIVVLLVSPRGLFSLDLRRQFARRARMPRGALP